MIPIASRITPAISVGIFDINSKTLPANNANLLNGDKKVSKNPSMAAESAMVPTNAVAKLKRMKAALPSIKRGIINKYEGHNILHKSKFGGMDTCLYNIPPGNSGTGISCQGNGRCNG